MTTEAPHAANAEPPTHTSAPSNPTGGDNQDRRSDYETSYRAGAETLLKLLGATAKGDVRWNRAEGEGAGRLDAHIGDARLSISAADPKGESFNFSATREPAATNDVGITLDADRDPLFQPLLRQLYALADGETGHRAPLDFSIIDSALSHVA